MSQLYPDFKLFSPTENPDFSASLLIEFTRVYRQFTDEAAEAREAACYQVQWKNMVQPIEPGDLFAGRLTQPPLGFMPQTQESMGYYLDSVPFEALLNHKALSSEIKEKLQEIKAFWTENKTVSKALKAFDAPMKAVLKTDKYASSPDISFMLWRMSGVQMDYAKLVRLGIPGLRSEIMYYLKKESAISTKAKLYNAMLIALDTLVEVCHFYAKQAQWQSEQTEIQERKNELQQMSVILEKLSDKKPETFREALQLIYLYNILDGARNYGRLDNALGDIFVSDMNAGMLDDEEAIRLLSSVWKLISDRNFRYDSRIIIGGRGRINEANADKLALLMMETTRRVKDIVPQLALRFYSRQNPALYQKAIDVIAEGNPFPMLYNDEVNIPAAMKAFSISEDEALGIIQYGCGEYVIDHKSVGTPSGLLNMTTALNVVLHKGINPVSGLPDGMPAERYEKYGNFETFDQLWQAYSEQIEFQVEQLARHEALEYDFAGKSGPFLYSSMLMDDCIARGKGIYSGGIRYLDGTLETYGNANTADALMAIKKLVYDEKRITFTELITALDADFEGFEQIRKMLLDAPKYGNDLPDADAMFEKVHNQVCEFTRNQAVKCGLHAYMVVIINNDANTLIGISTAASADGRKAGVHLNPGNNPSGGSDKNGVTALLNSLVKPRTDIHAGAVQNMKFGSDLLNNHRPKFEQLLNTYWKKGGAQAMLTVVGKGELEDAMLHPENYPNLLVRVGGFSERFVNLPRHTQLELISRTLY